MTLVNSKRLHCPVMYLLLHSSLSFAGGIVTNFESNRIESNGIASHQNIIFEKSHTLFCRKKPQAGLVTFYFTVRRQKQRKKEHEGNLLHKLITLNISH